VTKLSPTDALALWFDYLRKLQAACSFNTNVARMDLLTFANAKISAVLPTPTEQKAFAAAVQISPGFNIDDTKLGSYSSFEALLDDYDPLPTYVGNFLKPLAADPFPSGPLADFFKADPTAAFPGGSEGSQWQTALGRLSSVIPSVCFTSTFQKKVGNLLDAQGKHMSDVIDQIAGLG
jgi:hypothetical protein